MNVQKYHDRHNQWARLASCAEMDLHPDQSVINVCERRAWFYFHLTALLRMLPW